MAPLILRVNSFKSTSCSFKAFRSRTLCRLQEQALKPPAVVIREGAVIVAFGLPVEVTGKATGEAPQKRPREKPQKATHAVLELEKRLPALAFAEMVPPLGKSESIVKRAVRKLRESGRLQRIGPAKGGHWQVIE
jgi:hypothetical protein